MSAPTSKPKSQLPILGGVLLVSAGLHGWLFYLNHREQGHAREIPAAEKRSESPPAIASTKDGPGQSGQDMREAVRRRIREIESTDEQNFNRDPFAKPVNIDSSDNDAGSLIKLQLKRARDNINFDAR
jgi:hypothetical protein